MSLSSKIALGLILVIGLFAGANALIQDQVFWDRFVTVEQDHAQADLDRVRNAIAEEEHDLTAIAAAKVNSPLIAALLEDAQRERADLALGIPHQPSETARLAGQVMSPERLREERLDVLFLIDVTEEDGFGFHPVIVGHLEDGFGQPLELSLFPKNGFGKSHYLLNAASGLDEVFQNSGLMLTDHAPLLVSARRVMDENGEPRGTLILGRFLSGMLDQEITNQTKVDFDVWRVEEVLGWTESDFSISPELREVQSVADQVTSSPEAVVIEGDVLHVYGTYNDINHRPDLIVRANVERDVTRTGATALRFGQVSVLIGAFMMLLALMLLLDKVVIAPLKALTGHAVKIGTEEDFRAKLQMARTDELGTLSTEFDQMMGKLEVARATVMETARTAGMSEIATGILHNVGNVLNSVNISASMVAQRLDGMGLDDLERLVGVLQEHEGDLAGFIAADPRGQHLLPFLNALTGQLSDQRGQLQKEVGSLASGLDHICDLIKSQQQFAVKSDLLVHVDLATKLDEALSITHQALGEDPALEIAREYAEALEIELDKHRLLEILINLIQNARQAMNEAGSAPKRLTLRTKLDGEHVSIQIQDSGPGIEPDVLAKIFNLGFTTKSSGHGYGLHTAANAATEMGGALTADSGGKGEGATFTLRLPLHRTATTS